MLIQIRVSPENLESVSAKLEAFKIDLKLGDRKSSQSDYYIKCNIDPSKFRDINEVINSEEAVLEILEQAIVNKEIGRLDDSGHAK